jgi:hypothetical protein
MTSIKKEKQYNKIFLGYEARCGRENNKKSGRQFTILQ